MSSELTASMTVNARGLHPTLGTDPFVGGAALVLMDNFRAVWHLRWARTRCPVRRVTPFQPSDVVDAALYLAIAAVDMEHVAQFDYLVQDRSADDHGRQGVQLKRTSAEDRTALITAFGGIATAVCWAFDSSSFTSDQRDQVAASAGFVHTRLPLPVGPTDAPGL